jgi:transcriptional regulator
MYVPAHFAADQSQIDELLTHHGAADLITSTEQGLQATFLPFLYDPAVGGHGSLLGHVARNNDQWKLPTIGEAMVIVRGPDSYISPAWYAAKAEHGRVVPTWNYVTAHLYGELVREARLAIRQQKLLEFAARWADAGTRADPAV